jgi:hypothetical protein
MRRCAGAQRSKLRATASSARQPERTADTHTKTAETGQAEQESSSRRKMEVVWELGKQGGKVRGKSRTRWTRVHPTYHIRHIVLDLRPSPAMSRPQSYNYRILVYAYAVFVSINGMRTYGDHTGPMSISTAYAISSPGTSPTISMCSSRAQDTRSSHYGTCLTSAGAASLYVMNETYRARALTM